jgi:hypothetical protein
VRDVADLQRAAGTLSAFIIGALRREVTERRTARSTGTDEAAWQTNLGPYLTRQLETGRYPTIARLVLDGAHLDAEENFDRNLTTILDGITSRPSR